MSEATDPGLVTQLERARGEAQHLRQHLRLLSDLSRRVASVLEPEGILREVVESACQLTGARHGALALFDGSGAAPELFLHGITGQEWDRIGALPRMRDALAKVRQANEPLRLTDLVQSSPAAGDPIGTSTIRSFLGVAVRDGDRPVGALYLADKSGGIEFSAEDEELLLLFRDQAAVAIRNSRVFQRERESLARLEAANVALAESDSRLQAILDYTTAIIYIKDLEGRYLLINRRYEQFLGVDRANVIGKAVHDIVPAEAADAIRAHDQRVIATQSPHEWEEQIPLDDGMHVFLSQRFPLWDRAGTLYGVCGISTDITARTQRENERIEELQGLRSLVADAPVGVLIADAHTGRVLTVNHEAERINGFAHRPEFGWTEYEKAFIRRRLDGRVCDPEELPMRRALRGEVVQGEELWFEFPDGRRVRVLMNVTPVYGEDGRMAAVVATLQDVTDRAPTAARTPSQELRFSQARATAAGTARPVAAYASERGRTRETNEDSVYCEPAESERAIAKGWLYAVADGMGGAAMGEVASRTAISAVVEAYYESGGGSTALAAAVSTANEAVRAAGRARPESRGMGTTLTAAVVREGHVVVAHVGDSRAYLIESGAIRQVTQDHSWVSELMRAGALTPEQVRTFRYRNIITRALGRDDAVQVDLAEERQGGDDVLLLCSDGLSGVVEDAEIAGVASAQTPQQAAGSLMALARTRGSEDDTSIVVVRGQSSAGGGAP